MGMEAVWERSYCMMGIWRSCKVGQTLARGEACSLVMQSLDDGSNSPISSGSKNKKKKNARQQKPQVE